MKKLLLLVAIMLCCAMTMFAQNNKISYQAVVRDTANRLVANKTVTVAVNIFNGDATTAVYTETQTAQTNYNGLFSLQIGNGTNKSGNWNAINWKNARVTTAVSLNGTQLATLEMPLTAVPYALYADYAEQINPDATVVTDIYDKLGTKADTGSVYTRAIINDKLGAKADTSKVYTRTIIDNKLGAKADTSKVYTRTIIDNKLGAKADTSKVYTRIIIDNKLDAKANTADLANVATTGSYNDLSDVPTNLVQDANYHHTDHNFKDADSVKLAGIASGAEVNVQADWNETNENSDAFIKNKPEIPAAQVQANWNQTNENAVDYIKYKPTLANVATSGSYNDLTNKPTIPAAQVNSDWNATSGVSKIHNKPSITDSIRAYMDTCTAVIKNNDLCTSIVTCDNVALRYESNTFTQDNTFSGTISVPSNTTTFPTPSGKDYSNRADSSYAVSVRDLLAVFDSLSNRIQGVFDSLKHLNDSLANELEALKNTIPPTADAPTIKNLTSTSLTVKANNTSSGAAITSYEYCYSTNSDMSGATCQTSALDTLDLTGLTPKTDYYVTVKATNFAGSTTSSTTTARTPAHAPTATVNTPTSVPTGFKVEVTDIDHATTVQVCYKQGTSCSVDDNDYTCADAQTVASTDTANTQAITGLTANTNYCVIVKVSNGDSTTVYGPYTVTTGDNITLSLTSTGNGNVSLCGGTSVSATYTATPSNGTDNYTYSWNSGTAGTSNTYTATYTATGSYTVTCSATHTDGYTLTATATTTVDNSGTAVTIGLCDNYLTVTVKSVSGSPNAISWGDGATGTSVTASTTNPTSHTYSTSGTYTITASNSSGCTATYTMALAEAAHTSCTLSDMTTTTLNTNEAGTTAIDSVRDHEGNWYEVVQIGTQCWLKENLRTTTSPKTGTYLVNTAGKTGNSSSQLYGSKVAHWYNNNSTTYAPKGYGLLYNWCAAMDTANPSSYVEVPTSSTGNSSFFDFTPTGNHRGICPEGWHLPTDAEWNAMELVVNGSDVSSSTDYRGSHAGKLSTGCDWSKNTTANTANSPGNYSNDERNSSGFAAVPTGYFLSSFNYAGSRAYFWSSSQTSSGNAWYRALYSSNAGVVRNYYYKNYGLSVRCLRD